MINSLLNNRYKILNPLSSGGFGETFLAEDTQMPSKRKCVIKQLKPVAHNTQVYQLIQERFKREAATLEKLGHENHQIPQLYAYFEDQGQFYLVQEWIEGKTLTEKITTEGILPVNKVQSILIEILPVIDYLHHNKIIHRDIKPENIIIRNYDQKPILIDFGAVKEIMGTTVFNSGESASTIVIGTPGYMSAEQGAGRPMYSSDLYALGLTAIYLLTGISPHKLNTNPHTGEFDWENLELQIEPRFWYILKKSIRYNPGDRYPTASEMLKELVGITQVSPPFIPLPQTQPNQPNTNLTVTKLVTTNPAETKVSQYSGGFFSTLKDWQKVLLILIGMGLFTSVGVIISPYLFNRQTPENTPISANPIDNNSGVDSNPTPTADPIPKISPEDAVYNYYAYINQGQYETGWNQLSIDHQNDTNRHPKGYNSYLEWWTSVKSVTVISTNLITENEDYALVETILRYEMNKSKPFEQKLQFHFIWDESKNIWLVDWVDRIYNKNL
jgi:serine/threonine protein kinase, bacterial